MRQGKLGPSWTTAFVAGAAVGFTSACAATVDMGRAGLVHRAAVVGYSIEANDTLASNPLAAIKAAREKVDDNRAGTGTAATSYDMLLKTLHDGLVWTMVPRQEMVVNPTYKAIFDSGGTTQTIFSGLQPADVLPAAVARDMDDGRRRALIKALGVDAVLSVSASIRATSSGGLLPGVVQAPQSFGAIREKLFVAAPGVPTKIAEYAGRAPLRAWLRTVAVRAALNLRRGARAAESEAVTTSDERMLGGAGVDPEVRLAKARSKAVFEQALRAAVARLSAKERTLLRLHLVNGLSIDVLGAHYRVGRSTAARWLAAAREALREHTRAELMARLGPADLTSILAFVRSQLDLSAQGLLGEDPMAAPSAC